MGRQRQASAALLPGTHLTGGWVGPKPSPDAMQNRKIFNILKPTGHVTHHQFNIQQLYALPTLYLCVLYLSENKQRLVPLTA